MIDLYLKLIDIFISRKDKFNRADENFMRRDIFFKEIKEIEARDDLDFDQKRVLKDSSAQKLTGSSLVTYHFLDYFLRNDHFRNFEVSASTVAVWGTFISYRYLDDGCITVISVDKSRFYFQVSFGVIVNIFIIVALLVLTAKSETMVNLLASIYPISAGVAGVILGVFILLLICIFIFILYVLISFYEVILILE